MRSLPRLGLLWIIICAALGCSPSTEDRPAADVAEAKTSSDPAMIRIVGGSLDRWRIPTFWLDRTEVTVAAYQACVDAGHCEAPDTAPACNWGTDRTDHPMNCLVRRHADAYCRWKGLRLPSAQEWEWAARGRDEARTYPWGEELATCERAVIDAQWTGEMSASGGRPTQGCGRDGTWPVGSKPRGASRDGVLDLVGNVREWTGSLTHEITSSGRQSTVAGTAWFGGGTSPVHAASETTARPENEAGPELGFRCARDDAPTQPLESARVAIAAGQIEDRVVDAFELDTTEVSVRAYRSCVAAGVCREPASDTNCNFGDATREDHPINCVDWYDAEDYCAWVDARLQTADEWRWAAQGGDEGRSYPWGSEPPSCERAVLEDDTGPGCGRGATWSVASKPQGASREGVQDLGGNVWEWTASVALLPSPPDVTLIQNRRVLVGGGWQALGDTANEHALAADPGDRIFRERVIFSAPSLGFRCARSRPETKSHQSDG